MILSTAWTTAAVVIGAKTETRRDWSQKQIELAQRQVDTEAWVDLWDKSPRFKGKCYGRCKFLRLVLDEPSREIPDNAWYREGFHVLTPMGAVFSKGWGAPDVWRFWRTAQPGENLQTVVIFDRLELNAYGDELRADVHSRWPDLKPYTLEDLRSKCSCCLNAATRGIGIPDPDLPMIPVCDSEQCRAKVWLELQGVKP